MRCLLPAPAGAASTRPGLPAGPGLQPRRHPSESCGQSTATSSRPRRRGLSPSPSRGPAAARDPAPGPGGGHAAAATRPPSWPGSRAGAVRASSGRLRGGRIQGRVPCARLPGSCGLLAPVRPGFPSGLFLRCRGAECCKNSCGLAGPGGTYRDSAAGSWWGGTGCRRFRSPSGAREPKGMGAEAADLGPAASRREERAEGPGRGCAGVKRNNTEKERRGVSPACTQV